MNSPRFLQMAPCSQAASVKPTATPAVMLELNSRSRNWNWMAAVMLELNNRSNLNLNGLQGKHMIIDIRSIFFCYLTLDNRERNVLCNFLSSYFVHPNHTSFFISSWTGPPWLIVFQHMPYLYDARQSTPNVYPPLFPHPCPAFIPQTVYIPYLPLIYRTDIHPAPTILSLYIMYTQPVPTLTHPHPMNILYLPNLSPQSSTHPLLVCSVYLIYPMGMVYTQSIPMLPNSFVPLCSEFDEQSLHHTSYVYLHTHSL